MRLGPGEFFGTTNREVDCGGVRFLVTEYEPYEQQPWHVHQHPGFFAHLAGQQLDEKGDAEWEMPLLSLTYHSPQVLHRSRVGPRGAKGVNIEITEEWLQRHDLSTADLGENRVMAEESARTAALRLIRMYMPDPLPRHGVSDMVLELIESFVIRRFPAERLPVWLRRAEHRIRESFRDSIGLSTIASEVGVHATHLARVFRAHHGHSVTEHLQKLRISCAVDQILAGESIGLAALEAGFSDQFHFSRTLKAHFGYSPSHVKRLAS